MSQRLQSLMIAHGAIIFLLGLAAGVPFVWVVVSSIDPAQAAGIPGDVRAWRMAHLEGVLNGILLIAVAAGGAHLKLTPTAQQAVAWGLIVSGWCNIVASILSPLTNGRGVQFTGLDWNGLTYILFMIGVVGVVVGMGTLCVTALQRRSD